MLYLPLWFSGVAKYGNFLAPQATGDTLSIQALPLKFLNGYRGKMVSLLRVGL